MLPKEFIIVLLLLQNFFVYTQQYFSDRYNFENDNSLDYCQGILQHQDEYFIFGGFTSLENSYHNIGILKLNIDGSVVQQESIHSDSIWSYDIQYQNGGLKPTQGNSFYSTGMKRKFTSDLPIDKGMIFKFNAALDTIWTKSIGDTQLPEDSNYIFKHLDLLANNMLAIIGTVVIEGSKSIITMIKTDSSGNELWRKYFESGLYSDGTNIISTPDGGFAISAYKWTFGLYSISSPYVIKTDSLGNEKWRKHFAENASSSRHGPMYLMNSPDSTIIGVYSYSDSADFPGTDSWHSSAIAKIDLEGNLLWEERYAPSLYSGTWLSSAAITNDGKVIASGYKNNYPSYPLDVSFLICFSNNGDSLWYHTYSLLNANYSINTLFGVIPTSDGGFAAVGRVIPYPPDTGKQDVWVLKVDSLGNELPVTIGEQSGDRAENAEIEIYPNPASNSVTIILPIKDKAELVRLGIYNIYGNKVKEIQMPKDETRVTLNIGNWKNGMYIVTAIEGNRIIEKRKFIKY